MRKLREIICFLTLFISTNAFAGAATEKQIDIIKNSTGGNSLSVPSTGSRLLSESDISLFPTLDQWVSTSIGNDANPGSTVLQKQTIGSAISACQAAGASETSLCTIHLNSEFYNNCTPVTSGIVIRGIHSGPGFFDQASHVYCNNGSPQPIPVAFGSAGGDIYFVDFDVADMSGNHSGVSITSQLSTTQGFNELNLSGMGIGDLSWPGVGSNTDFLEVYDRSSIRGAVTVDSIGIDYSYSNSTGTWTVADTAGNGGAYLAARFANFTGSHTYTSTVGGIAVNYLHTIDSGLTSGFNGSGALVNYDITSRPGTLTATGGAVDPGARVAGPVAFSGHTAFGPSNAVDNNPILGTGPFTINVTDSLVDATTGSSGETATVVDYFTILPLVSQSGFSSFGVDLIGSLDPSTAVPFGTVSALNAGLSMPSGLSQTSDELFGAQFTLSSRGGGSSDESAAVTAQNFVHATNVTGLVTGADIGVIIRSDYASPSTIGALKGEHVRLSLQGGDTSGITGPIEASNIQVDIANASYSNIVAQEIGVLNFGGGASATSPVDLMLDDTSSYGGTPYNLHSVGASSSNLFDGSITVSGHSAFGPSNAVDNNPIAGTGSYTINITDNQTTFPGTTTEDASILDYYSISPAASASGFSSMGMDLETFPDAAATNAFPALYGIFQTIFIPTGETQMADEVFGASVGVSSRGGGSNDSMEGLLSQITVHNNTSVASDVIGVDGVVTIKSDFTGSITGPVVGTSGSVSLQGSTAGITGPIEAGNFFIHTSGAQTYSGLTGVEVGMSSDGTAILSSPIGLQLDDLSAFSGSPLNLYSQGPSSKNKFDGTVLIGALSAASANAFLVVDAGHIKSTQAASPVATVNSNAGTGATCSAINATDIAGSINLTTAALLSSAGVECSVAFNKAYAVAPICMLSATNANAILDSVVQGVYLTASTTGIAINFANTDAVGRSYSWNYTCIETQ